MNYILENISDELAKVSAETVSKHIILRLIEFQFIDSSNNWKIDLPEKSKNQLTLPIRKDELNNFIREISENVEKNPYLCKIIDELDKNARINIKKYNRLIYEALSFAIVLERLNIIVINKPYQLNMFVEFFDKQMLSYRPLKLTTKIKYKSVEIALKKVFLHAINRNNFSVNQMRRLLMLNIVEASFYDLFKLRIYNGFAGFLVAINFIRKVSINKNGMLYVYFKNTRRWINIYQSWNMAFVFALGDWHIAITKLLIPSVSGSFKEPGLFLEKRVIALYFYVSYARLNYKTHEHYSVLHSFRKNMLKKWGKINLFSNL